MFPLCEMARQINVRSGLRYLKQENFTFELRRCFAVTSTQFKKHKGPETQKGPTIESVGESLSAKGFLRSHKPYTALNNAGEKVRALCNSLKISSASDYRLENMEEKFKILNACFKDFQHSVPNSQLYELQTIGDIINFYEQSVDTTVPYDAFKKIDLPENLHIQYDYVRFNPETDTKFNGQTAFPKSSTLVTGLKYREKYKGFTAKRSWP